MSYNIQELLQESNKKNNKLFSMSQLKTSFIIPDIKDFISSYMSDNARNNAKKLVELIIEKELYGLKLFVYSVSNNSNVEAYHKYISTHQLPDIELKGYEFYHLQNTMYIDKALITYIDYLETIWGKVNSIINDTSIDVNVRVMQMRETEEDVIKLLDAVKRRKVIKYEDFGFPYNTDPNDFFKDNEEKTIIYNKSGLEDIYKRLKYAKSHYYPMINRYVSDISKYYTKMDKIYYDMTDLSKRIIYKDIENQNTRIANHILIMNKEMILILESVIKSQVTNIRDSIVQDLNVCGYINENFNKKGE